MAAEAGEDEDHEGDDSGGVTSATVRRFGMLQCSCLGGGPLEMSGALLERGADVHAKDPDGYDACWRACCNGNQALVALLLDKCASPHTRPPTRITECSGKRTDCVGSAPPE